MTGLLYLLITFIFIFLFSYKIIRIGNWSHLYGNFELDPKEFYSQVEKVLKDRQVPNFHIRPVTYKQMGLLSRQRLYLEVSRGAYVFHICAAPWGTDFFFSWWLGHRILNIKVILGSLISNSNQLQTYYKLDTDTMFRTSVQQAVLEALKEFTDAKGIRALTELESKPDLRSLLK